MLDCHFGEPMLGWSGWSFFLFFLVVVLPLGVENIDVKRSILIWECMLDLSILISATLAEELSQMDVVNPVRCHQNACGVGASCYSQDQGNNCCCCVCSSTMHAELDTFHGWLSGTEIGTIPRCKIRNIHNFSEEFFVVFFQGWDLEINHRCAQPTRLWITHMFFQLLLGKAIVIC